MLVSATCVCFMGSAATWNSLSSTLEAATSLFSIVCASKVVALSDAT